MSDRNKNIALIALGVVLIGMTIAYAALQTNLSIGGTASTTAVTWDVHIENWKQDSISTPAPTITAPTITATSITNLGVSLDKPGQSVVYSFDIVNKGTIDAKLAAKTGGFTCTQTGQDACANISYNLNCGAGAQTANTDVLVKSTGTAHCLLTISRKEATVSQDANQKYTDTGSDGTFEATWQYVQN